MSEQLSLTPFAQVANHATKHQRLPPPTSHLYRNELVYKYLPIIRTRPASIVSKEPYPLCINPQNIHPSTPEQDRYQPLQSEITSTAFAKTHTQPDVMGLGKSLFPFNDVAYMYSPYGPTNFQLTDTPFYPQYDRHFHTNPSLAGKIYSSTIIAVINNLTKLAIKANNVYSDLNDDLIYNTVEANKTRNPTSPDDPKRPIITFSNHNTTMDDPFIIVKMHPKMNRDNCRWEICGQDICYLTPFISSGFIAGRVLPIQRGSGLHQPQFTRLHNLLSNGEWVHLFPEGKVQFTPTYDGLDHELADPPAQLLPFKWGIGALIAETLLRGQKPSVIPVMHTSARVHPRSNGLPQAFQDSSILVGDDVLDQVKPLVDDYITQVYAYETNRWTVEPSKEILFADITAKIKHISDMLYYNVENHQQIPATSKLKKTLEKYKTLKNDSESTQSSPNDIRHRCKALNCFCQHDDGFETRQTYQQQLIFRDQLRYRQVESVTNLLKMKGNKHLDRSTTDTDTNQEQELDSKDNKNLPPLHIQPWFTTLSIVDDVKASKINDDELGPDIIFNYLHSFQQFITTPTSEKPTMPAALLEPIPTVGADGSPLDEEQVKAMVHANAILQRAYDHEVSLSSAPFSTHHIPRKLHIATNRFNAQREEEDRYQYDLSMRIENFLKPQFQWGNGKYAIGLDGINSHQEATEIKTDEDYFDPLSNRIGPSNRNWYRVWSDRNGMANDEFLSYLPQDHSLVIDKKSFESTWKEYLAINYDNIAVRLKGQLIERIEKQEEEKKLKEEEEKKKQQQLEQDPNTPQNQQNLSEQPLTDSNPLETTQKSQQQPPRLPTALNQSAIRDMTYLTEVFMLRNRFEVYRRSFGFDWNGV